MKFDFKTILILSLTVVIICLMLFWPKGEPSKVITMANDSIETINQENRILRMNARTLELTIQDTNAKKKADSTRFVTEITVKNQQLAKKRVRIDTVFKDNEVVQDYLQTADSVFAMMHQRIDSLEAEKQFQQSLYSEMIYIQNKRILNLEIVSSQKDIIIADQAKTIKKSRRGNKIWKAAAVVGTIGGFLFGTSL